MNVPNGTMIISGLRAWEDDIQHYNQLAKYKVDNFELNQDVPTLDM